MSGRAARWLPIAVGACVAVATVAWMERGRWRHDRAPGELPDGVRLESGAVVRPLGRGELSLERGSLSIEGARLRVYTRELTASAVGARWTIGADAEGTIVAVGAGRVRVERGEAVDVGAGQRLVVARGAKRLPSPGR